MLIIKGCVELWVFSRKLDAVYDESVVGICLRR
jgi:hypothetical protein